MSKKITVNDGIFTIVDTVTKRLEYQSLASITYLSKIGTRYYFYYDTFVVGDKIKKSRSIDYDLSVFVGATTAKFNSEEELKYWAGKNLALIVTTTEGGLAAAAITEYRSIFEVDGYIYSGYKKDTVPYILDIKMG